MGCLFKGRCLFEGECLFEGGCLFEDLRYIYAFDKWCSLDRAHYGNKFCISEMFGRDWAWDLKGLLYIKWLYLLMRETGSTVSFYYWKYIIAVTWYCSCLHDVNPSSSVFMPLIHVLKNAENSEIDRTKWTINYHSYNHLQKNPWSTYPHQVNNNYCCKFCFVFQHLEN